MSRLVILLDVVNIPQISFQNVFWNFEAHVFGTHEQDRSLGARVFRTCRTGIHQHVDTS